jgi:hypothetical protein
VVDVRLDFDVAVVLYALDDLDRCTSPSEPEVVS